MQTSQLVPIETLVPWADQPRHGGAAPDPGLEAAIRTEGVLNPLIVRPRKLPGHGYEIVAGERRFHAAKAVGLTELPVVVRELDNGQARAIALIENIHRKPMNAMEEAEAYRALRDGKPAKSIPAIAAAVGQSEHYVYRRLRLLALEKPLQDAIARGALSIEHAELLMQLPAPRRKEAIATDGRGVVWSRSPLLESGEKWEPSFEDLQPIHKLRAFLRERAALDPASADAKHFQPELTQQITEAIEERLDNTDEPHPFPDGEEEALIEKARASVLRLSEDPMVRMRLGAAANDKSIPLGPSHWKEVKPGSCDYHEIGAVVHGGPSRVIPAVCVLRKCAKHWPKPKKKAASAKASKKPAKPAESYQARWKREEIERKAEAARWDRVFAEHAAPALIEHLQKFPLNVPFVTTFLDGTDPYGNKSSTTKDVKHQFGVTLTSDTLALVLALSTIHAHNHDAFGVTSRVWRFDMKPIDVAMKQLETAEKAATKKPATKTAKKGKKGREK